MLISSMLIINLIDYHFEIRYLHGLAGADPGVQDRGGGGGRKSFGRDIGNIR